MSEITVQEVLNNVYDNTDPLHPKLRVGSEAGEGIDAGTATSGTTTKITDTTKRWVVNQFIDLFVKIIDGTNKGATGQIVSNTATELTITPAFSITIDSTSEYVIYDVSEKDKVQILDAGGSVINPAYVETVYIEYNEALAISKTYDITTDLGRVGLSLFFRADQPVSLKLNGAGNTAIVLSANEEFIKSNFKVSSVIVTIAGATNIKLHISG